MFAISGKQSQLLFENYSNFKRSGVPAQFMYYEDGSWIDFSNEALHSLRSGFLEDKPMIEVSIGSSRCLFDFYRMLQIDWETGNQRSISWIDVNDKCFFPKTFIDGGGDFANVSENLSSEYPKIKLEIKNGEMNSNKRKRKSVDSEDDENTEGSSSSDQRQESKKRQLIVSDLESPRWPKAKLLKEGEKAYSVVKKLFLSWLGVVDPGARVTVIHQCMRTGPLDRARYEIFQKQMEITRAAREKPNMTFAWHGTSANGVTSILTHGFGMPSKISGHESHGIGIYLSPLRSSSAMLCEVDDNGERHVILCRVILGKCEKVEPGSKQLYPSSVDFDTGVDDVKNPKWYVVWCANMNTHILPECVVSYKSAHRQPGPSGGSTFLKCVPNGSIH